MSNDGFVELDLTYCTSHHLIVCRVFPVQSQCYTTFTTNSITFSSLKATQFPLAVARTPLPLLTALICLLSRFAGVDIHIQRYPYKFKETEF